LQYKLKSIEIGNLCTIDLGSNPIVGSADSGSSIRPVHYGKCT